MMKRIVSVVLVLVLLAAGTAFAEDGFKIFLGYSVGHLDNSFVEEGNYYANTYKYKLTAIEHGPTVDARYEGSSIPVFIRATFDYNFLASAKEKYADQFSVPYKGHVLTTELDLGYKVYSQGNFGLTPYVGMGYFERNATDKNDTAFWDKYYTPYAAAGAVISYTEPKWSVGLDAAFLLPFSGKTKYSDPTTPLVRYSFSNEIGVGARIQLPVTYTIIPKKGHAIGLMLFATPLYTYVDPGKSRNFDQATSYAISYTNKITKDTFSTYAIKAGLGFAF